MLCWLTKAIKLRVAKGWTGRSRNSAIRCALPLGCKNTMQRTCQRKKPNEIHVGMILACDMNVILNKRK